MNVILFRCVVSINLRHEKQQCVLVGHASPMSSSMRCSYSVSALVELLSGVIFSSKISVLELWAVDSQSPGSNRCHFAPKWPLPSPTSRCLHLQCADSHCYFHCLMWQLGPKSFNCRNIFCQHAVNSKYITNLIVINTL